MVFFIVYTDASIKNGSISYIWVLELVLKMKALFRRIVSSKTDINTAEAQLVLEYYRMKV